MNNVKYAINSSAATHRRLQLHCFHAAANFTLRSLIVALMLGMAGCATHEPAPVLTPPIQVSDSNRWQIDRHVHASSLAATAIASDYARASMRKWRDRVHQRTETDFIPWFTGYWTQEGLAFRMAWYKARDKEGAASAKERLIDYLQQQYHDQVLQRVAQEIDLDAVREQATTLYVHVLYEQLAASRRQDGVPRDQVDQRLKDIAAIAVASPPPVPSASLFQLIHANPMASLPAYTAMIGQIRKEAMATESVLLEDQISPVATRSSEMLGNKLAASGGISAAAAVLGGIPGIVLSLGAAGVEAAANENQRPKMEKLLRENLNAALNDMYASFMDDHDTGVMAGVYCISGQIEQSLAKASALPVKPGPAPSAVLR